MSGDVKVISALIKSMPIADLLLDATQTGDGSGSNRRRQAKKMSAFLNAPDSRHQTPLHTAVVNNRVDAVQELLSVSFPQEPPKNNTMRYLVDCAKNWLLVVVLSSCQCGVAQYRKDKV